MTRDIRKEILKLDEDLQNFDILKDLTDDEVFAMELKREYLRGYYAGKNSKKTKRGA